MRISLKSFVPAVLAFIGATVLFCMPGDEFPEEDWFGKIFLDKWVHVGLFTVLVSLSSLPWIFRPMERSTLHRLFIGIALAFVAYGIAIEFIQGRFIPHRTFGVDDMVADSVGCLIGWWFSNAQLKKHLD